MNAQIQTINLIISVTLTLTQKPDMIQQPGPEKYSNHHHIMTL